MNYYFRLFIAGFIFLLTFSLEAKSLPPAGYGQTSVKKWADDRKSAFSFTFDDGYMSQYDYARPILNSFGFKGTFFPITSCMTDDLPAIWRYGTWNQFRTMALEGHEIGSHTVTHPDLTTLKVGNISTSGTLLYELYQSKSVIEQKIPSQKCITLNYPYIVYNSTVINNTSLYYESARTGSDSPNNSSLSGSGYYTIGAKEEQFNTPRNSTQDDLDELANMEAYTQNSIDSGKWGMLMAHEIYPFSQIAGILQQGSWYPMSTEWLTSLCQWVKQKSDIKDIWVETMANITRYMKERDNYQNNIIAQNSTEIQIKGSTGLNSQIYNFPLTVDISVPPDWQDVIVRQGTLIDTVTTFLSAGTTYIRTSIVPDGTILTLDKKVNSVTYSIAGTVSYNNASSTKLKNVKVTFTGPNGYQNILSTDATGIFNLTGLNSGSYTITFNKTDEFSEVNSTDALMVIRNFTNQVSFDSIQTAAGDVNNDQMVNSTDALQIIRRYAGIISSFTKPVWLFAPAAYSFTLNQNLVLNIKGILTGDVNESYSGVLP